MRRSFVLRMVCIAALCLACSSVFAQEFSADMVSKEGRDNTEHTAKIYVAKNKIRFDGVGGRDQNGSAILNYDTQTMTIIMTQQHMYMENKFDQGPMAQQQKKFMFLQSVDVENACTDWQKMTDRPGRSCQKVGDEVINGRPTVKYATVSNDGKNGTVWIDKDLKFPVKWEEADGSGELKNIQVGAQSASLFEPPAGFQKFDMGNMMMKGQH